MYHKFLCILNSLICQVVVGPNGQKPQRKMREAATLLKENMLAGKKLKIVDQFAIKLPDVNSHKFHATEGEVQ